MAVSVQYRLKQADKPIGSTLVELCLSMASKCVMTTNGVALYGCRAVDMVDYSSFMVTKTRAMLLQYGADRHDLMIHMHSKLLHLAIQHFLRQSSACCTSLALPNQPPQNIETCDMRLSMNESQWILPYTTLLIKLCEKCGTLRYRQQCVINRFTINSTGFSDQQGSTRHTYSPQAVSEE